MFRATQMIIAQAISRRGIDPTTYMLDIADNDIAPLSIYAIVDKGQAGNWAGPHKAAMNALKAVQATKYPPIELVVCQDGIIVEQYLKPNTCILVPLRLGLDTLNPCYVILLLYQLAHFAPSMN
jgi:hypothetical protein